MTGMEAALVSGVLKVAGGKLVSLIASEFASITGVRKHLCELEGKHKQISCWLAVVRDRETGSSTQLQWVKELRNVAYDIDDLLYEVHLEAEKHKIHSEGDKQPLANCLCAKPKSFLFRCKVARKINTIKVKYDEIVKQAGDANTIRNNLQIDCPVRSSNRTAGELSMLSNNVEDSRIPKRDQEKDEIVSKILEPNGGEDGRPMIVSIVGLGGSGKTTLAKHVCHGNNIKDHFQNTIFWVHVSEEFDPRKLIGKLFQAITKKKYDIYAEEHMLSEISKKLRAKKSLIVLDDAWHKERDGWEQFMVHLKSSAPGSKILITTRDRKIAEVVKSRHVFELKPLSEAESWSLFLKRSEWVEEDLDSEYIQVGKEILNRCGGLPLAIKTLGGILYEKKEINIWRAIRDSDLWTEKSINDKVLASLRLSFIHLADEVKQCFTFCSIFPKGYEIYKDHLIAQWVAHGFINAMDGVQPEDVGCDYFDSLVKVGFLHDPYVDWDSKQLAWKMHDLIHDLARDILQDDIVTCLPNNMRTQSTHSCRYLSLTTCNEKVGRGLFDKVRALYICCDNPSFTKLVKKSCLVLSVTLHDAMDTPFPLFVMKFKYLGYLEINNLQSREPLPEAISGCWNLQALIFLHCSGFVALPESIGKLKKLRTLELRHIRDLESLPQSLGNCRDLRYLKLYSCRKLVMIPISLGRNSSLKLLEIVNCEDLKQLPSEFIGKFTNLQTFSFARCSRFQDLPLTLSCPMMCTLDLSWTNVTMLPQWVTTIGTLECINLKSCMELVELPKGIGNLKWLKVLNIVGCEKVCCMPSGIGQLARLTQLGMFVVGCGGDDVRISELENLDKLSGELKITNLKHLKDPCDAEKACLKRKNSIQNLVLDWSLNEAEEELASDMELDLGVLNGLEPPPHIEDMIIRGYRGPCLPRWCMEQKDSSYCSTLLKQSSPRQFLSLTELELSQFPNLKYMKGVLKFPSLKSLILYNMANLEELWTTTSGFEILDKEVRAEECFPVLSGLSIKDCPNLSTVKPYFPPSLENLYLVRNNQQLLSSDNFSRLLSLPANGSSLSCGLHSAIPHLKTLQLDEMTGSSSDGLEFLQHCTELETLFIKYGFDLTQLNEGIRSLTSLQRLKISNCPTLGALPECLGELYSLQDLDVSFTPKIVSLPQSIGYLTSLTKLRIFWLNNLKLLPESIGQLSALRQLWIQGCSALQCLPQSIQCLHSLHSLHIYSCPTLASRYKKGVGVDGHLVSHIPYVQIL